MPFLLRIGLGCDGDGEEVIGLLTIRGRTARLIGAAEKFFPETHDYVEKARLTLQFPDEYVVQFARRFEKPLLMSVNMPFVVVVVAIVPAGIVIPIGCHVCPPSRLDWKVIVPVSPLLMFMARARMRVSMGHAAMALAPVPLVILWL